MNRKTHVLGLMTALAAGVALLAACSGDEGNKSSGGGGAGSSSAGTGGGKAGSSSTSGGSSNSGGTNNNAGTNNTGGFNFGGDGGIDPGELMCDPVPEQGSACEEDAQPCFNGNVVCGCSNGEWMCIELGGGEGGGPGGGFEQTECPDEQPMSGDECSGLGFCPYGGQNMGCGCDGSTWTCTN